MDIGKFPAELLGRLLGKNAVVDPRVLVGPKIGEDAAVIDMGEKLLVAKSDPVTFAADAIGWYAVQVNANDVACTGGIPKWFLATLLVPERFSEAEAEQIFDQVLEACRELDVSLVGGHSEVTYGIDRPMLLGTMLGEVERDRLVHTGGAQEGDSIVLTKGIAIEGVALLARDFSGELQAAGVEQRVIVRAREYLRAPGISVMNDARLALETVTVHSLHDPTEGGLVTGLREVAQASGLGLAIEEGSVPILPECKAICDGLGLDPLGLLASGALLITLAANEVPKLLLALEREGITGWEIGQMLAPEEGLIMIGYEGEVPMPTFPRDEMARFLAGL